MDAKPHYFRIGLFVLAAVALIVIAVILFGAGLFTQNRLEVESYFVESITGLSVGSPVEFRGVRIGQVDEIDFVGSIYNVDQNTPAGAAYASEVRVVSGILRSKFPERDTQQIEVHLARMVARGLRARISSNLLTQQAFLEFNFLDPNRFPAEKVPWVSRNPVVPAATSEFTTLKGSLDRILTQLQEIDAKGLSTSLEKVFTSLNTAITQANIAELSKDARALLRSGQEKLDALEMAKINAAAEQFLASLNRAVDEANVPQLSRQVRGLLASVDRAVADANVPGLSQDARTLIAELQTVAKYLQTLLKPPAGAAAPNVPEAVARLNQTLARLNGLIATERPGLERVLTDLREITDSLKELIASLEQNPSELLFSKPPKKSEVLK